MDPQNSISNNFVPNLSQTPPLTVSVIKPETKFKIKPLNLIFIVIVVIISAILIYPQIVKPTTLSISATGKVSTIPESVSLVVTRTNIAVDPAIAIDAGESGLNILINEAKNIVGADAEIQKSFYTTSLSSSQQTVAGQAPLKLFQVNNGFKISFKDVSKTSDLIKTLYSMGATAISNVSFIPADKDKTEQEARSLAMENTKIEANKIAGSMGKRVGRVVSFVFNQSDASSTISSSQASFGTESIDITKTVSVIYEIW